MIVDKTNSGRNPTDIRITLDRPIYVWAQRIGKTLDIGTNDGSLVPHAHNMMGQEFCHDNDWLVSFDIDHWNLPNFVRGDAHRLPFKTDSFDTVVMADMLEHTPDPVKILKEASRIAKSLLIVTLPNEAEWHQGMNALGETDISEETMIANTLDHPSLYSKCLDYVSEKTIRHMPHLHAFDFYTVYDLITRALGRKYKVSICNLYHDNPNKEEFEDTPYWGITIDLERDISEFKYNVTDIG